MRVKKENLVKASKLIFCSEEKVLVLIWDSEKFGVHRLWIQYYFRFKIFVKPEIRLNPKSRLKPSPVNPKLAYSLSPDFLFSPSPDFVYTRESSIIFTYIFTYLPITSSY